MVPSSSKVSTGTDRSGPRFRTIAEAADEAERLAGERPPRAPRRADPDSLGMLVTNEAKRVVLEFGDGA